MTAQSKDTLHAPPPPCSHLSCHMMQSLSPLDHTPAGAKAHLLFPYVAPLLFSAAAFGYFGTGWRAQGDEHFVQQCSAIVVLLRAMSNSCT